MLWNLLQIDAMAEATFNLKDVIYVMTGVVGIGSYILRDKIKSEKMSHTLEQMKTECAKDVNDLKEKQLGYSASKKATIKELKSDLEKSDKIVHARIDKFKGDFESYVKETQAEMKEVTKMFNDLDKKLDTEFASIKAEIKNLQK
jgi:phenylalanyl-tRNA synthetase alpha subunit